MKFILTLTLSILALVSNAQDSLSRHAFSSSFYAGVPLQQYLSTSEWYKPGVEFGFTQSYSVRLKNRFFLSVGVGINHREYSTDPFIRSWTTYSYSPLQGVYNVQNHTDESERQTRGSFTRVKVPLQMEYMPLGKWTPYARAGFVFDAEIRGSSTDVYANTTTELPVADQSYETVYSEDFSLSATLSGGIKYGVGNVELLFGLSSQVGLTNLRRNYGSNNASIVGEISIRKTIAHDKFPHQTAIKIDPLKHDKKNYLYIEGIGSVPWASLNYERSIFQYAKNRVHARIGFSAEKSGSGVNTIVPLGLTYIYGRKHGFEAGSEFVQVFGHQHSYLASHLGYRVEMDKNVLLRFNVVGAWYHATNQFFIMPGASLGFRF